MPLSQAREADTRSEDFTSEPVGVNFTPAPEVDGLWVEAPGADRAILYLFGGGFVLGSPDTRRKTAGHLALAAKARVRCNAVYRGGNAAHIPDLGRRIPRSRRGDRISRRLGNAITTRESLITIHAAVFCPGSAPVSRIMPVQLGLSVSDRNSLCFALHSILTSSDFDWATKLLG